MRQAATFAELQSQPLRPEEKTAVRARAAGKGTTIYRRSGRRVIIQLPTRGNGSARRVEGTRHR